MQLGYYGKTVHRGDFIRFNLPKAFITPWDDWLQQVLLHGEEKHGGAWQERYQPGGCWRFSLAPGIAGERAWVGVIIPSEDKVGRRFPLCIAGSLPPDIAAPIAFSTHTVLLDKMQHLVLSINDSGYDFEQLQDDMLALETYAKIAVKQPEYTPGHEREDGVIQVMADSHTALYSAQGAGTLLHGVLHESVFQYSIWSTAEAAESPATFIASGLPPVAAGVALFDADWQSTGTAFVHGMDNDDGNTRPYIKPADSSEAPATPVMESQTTDTQLTDTPIDSSATATETSDNGDVFSTGDWTDFESSPPSSDQKPVTPTVEPLELDEDSTTTEPWEQ